MYIDSFNLYSKAVALAASAFSDVIDHKSDARLGAGEPMNIRINTKVAPDATNADETYVAELQFSVDEAFSVPIIAGSVTIDRDDPVGTAYYIDIAANSPRAQYSRISYTLGGTTPSVTLDAYLVPKDFNQNTDDYPIGYEIA